jgi:quinol monooxygenase YgiN
MVEEVVYVDRFQIREGKTEDFKRYAKQLTEFVESNEPGVASFNFYLDHDGVNGTAIFVFSDAEALDRHLDLASSKFQEGYELLSHAEIDLLGQPSRQAIEMGEAFNASVKSPLAGFSRRYQQS